MFIDAGGDTGYYFGTSLRDFCTKGDVLLDLLMVG